MKNHAKKTFSGLVIAVVFVVGLTFYSEASAAECTIQSATFSPSGSLGDKWFKDNARPNVKLTVVGSPECVGKTAEVSLVEDDTVGVDDDVAGIDDLEVKFPTSARFTINLKAGETDCEQWGGNDCEYFIKVDLSGADNFSTEDKGGAGNLEYDCDTSCDEGWTVGLIERPGGDASPGTVPGDAGCTPPKVEKDGKCVDNEYKLLSPLPCPPGTDNCPGGQLEKYNFTEANNLSRYINTIIRIFIGLCAVLAVIMIIIGGLEYMTSELISNKESGKEKIWGAVFGLVLALGAWTILNQINPDLLKADISSWQNAEVEVEFEPEVGVGSEVINTSGGRQLKACDSSQLKTISLFGHNVTVHNGVVSSLIRIEAKRSSIPSLKNYRVVSIGGYNCRQVTGKKGFWSAHAYGLALDINPSTNPYGKVLKTDMPPEFRKLFLDEHWGWGGNWNSVKDAMHFSKFPPAEGGDGVFEF